MGTPCPGKLTSRSTLMIFFALNFQALNPSCGSGSPLFFWHYNFKQSVVGGASCGPRMTDGGEIRPYLLQYPEPAQQAADNVDP